MSSLTFRPQMHMLVGAGSVDMLPVDMLPLDMLPLDMLAVNMLAVHHFRRHQMKLPMADSGVGDGCLGELPQRAGFPLQNDHFQAIFVVQMDMQRRQHQIVAGMLRFRQSPRQFPLVVVIDVGQTADGMTGAAVSCTVLLHSAAQQIADRLGTVRIAAAMNEGVELGKQIVIE